MPASPTATPHAIIPHLAVRPAAEAIGFYKRAFGFEEVIRMPGPGGQGVMHAQLRLGGNGGPVIMLADEWPGAGVKSPASLGGSTITIHLYVPDVDAAFDRAVKAGAKADMPPADMFWGDRYAKVTDPFGHHWSLATHKEDVSADEMKRRGDEMFKNWKPPGG